MEQGPSKRLEGACDGEGGGRDMDQLRIGLQGFDVW